MAQPRLETIPRTHWNSSKITHPPILLNHTPPRFFSENWNSQGSMVQMLDLGFENANVISK
ncbi:hypothetical protein Leryth_015164 [Lithospermum erythrorhizon]|nr:hypothetical protein Leryth_015164 [Lithospermum erythrorhizon]